MRHIVFFLTIYLIGVFSPPANCQEIEWQNTIGGGGNDQLISVVQTVDGGYIVGGFSNSDISGDKADSSRGNNDYWLMKLDSSGIIQWQNTIGGNADDQLHSVVQTTDGGFFLGGFSASGITGEKSDSLRGYTDYWVVKLNAVGNIQWQNTIGGVNDDRLYSVAQTTDGGYILGGWSNSGNSGDKSEDSLGFHDYWVVKLDTSGAIQWQNTIGGAGEDVLYSLLQTSDMGYLLGGRSNSGISGDKTEDSQGGDDFWIVKLDSTGGAIIWQKTIGGSALDHLKSIEETADGAYLLGGNSRSGISGDKTEDSQGLNDFWVVKLDTSGTILWQNTIGGSGDDVLNSVKQTADGGYILGGWSGSGISGDKTEGSQGAYDYWVIKLDTSGIIKWQNTIGGSGFEQINSIGHTTDGGHILGGNSDSNISGDKTENSQGNQDYWVIKLTEKYNLIQGVVYADLNSNSIKDPNESYIRYNKINELNSGRFAVTDTNGFYSLSVLDSGNFNVEPTQVNYYTAAPGSHNVFFSSILQVDSLNDFAFQPNGTFNDLCAYLTPVGDFRAGRKASYIINYSNYGTTTLTPQIVFYLDSSISYVSSSLNPVFISQDSIVFNVGSLAPHSHGQITITVSVGLFTPLGTSIISGITIFPIVGDVNPNCNQDLVEIVTTSSYDPNDILVDRDTLFDYQLVVPSYLEYIIRFQNTGNDTAFYVGIENPITSDLDLNTFEFISTSHPCSIEYLEYDSTMRFKFYNILLPDSNVNEPLSHGFVRYHIKPYSTLSVGDSIENNARIYFDYNAPVVTNTVVTEIVMATGLNEHGHSDGSMTIFPNPSNDVLNIRLTSPRRSTLQVAAYNVYGQLVTVFYNGNIHRGELNLNIDISQLSEGVYFIKVNGIDIESVKFVKY